MAADRGRSGPSIGSTGWPTRPASLLPRSPGDRQERAVPLPRVRPSVPRSAPEGGVALAATAGRPRAFAFGPLGTDPPSNNLPCPPPRPQLACRPTGPFPVCPPHPPSHDRPDATAAGPLPPLAPPPPPPARSGTHQRSRCGVIAPWGAHPRGVFGAAGHTRGRAGGRPAHCPAGAAAAAGTGGASCVRGSTLP